MRLLFLVQVFLVFSLALSAQYTLSGKVVNQNGEPLDFASVFIKDSDFAAATEPDGSFELNNVPAGIYTIKASFVGYESIEETIDVVDDVELVLELKGTIFELDEINIQSTRARKENPITYSTVDREEIEDSNIAQDVPYMLRWQPSVTVTSDAGTGIGYTGIRVRGSEPSRTNVTINGVPLNDSESQNVFWVDLPDFLANVDDVQIQRGVGVSTNGTSAFGATVHLNTDEFRQNSFAIISSGLGSFNTNKLSVHLGTGLLNNSFSLEGRYSLINSDGYVDRASSNLDSYYFSASKVSDGSSLKLNIFSGTEVTYQAWDGLPYQYLDTIKSLRTYNANGTEKSIDDPYENEIDNYRQTHGQLIYNKAIGSNGTLNLTGHITQGDGYFEDYKANKYDYDYNLGNDSIRQDIVIQRWLKNLFYGAIFSYEHETEKMNLVFGGGANQYDGQHYGEVIWQETVTDTFQKAVRYYDNDALKREGNVYGRLSYKVLPSLIPFVDLQYRAVSYTYEGPDDNGSILDINDKLGFFNPKVGISYLPNDNNKVYVYYGVANREPARSEYTESTPSTRPKHETLRDLELGYNFSNDVFRADITVYNMQYKDQLVPLGQLGDTGEPIRTNVDDSYRRGIEIGLLAKAGKILEIGYFGTLSQNKITSFTEFVDNWEGPQEVVEHTDTDIAYSPSQIHTITTQWNLMPSSTKHRLAAQLNFKYVGEQFLDNTSSEFAKLDPFSYLDFRLNFNTSFWKVKNMGLTLKVNNLLNQEYVTNGWAYRFISPSYNPIPDDPYARVENASENQYNLSGYYPQAGRNFMLGLRVEF